MRRIYVARGAVSSASSVPGTTLREVGGIVRGRPGCSRMSCGSDYERLIGRNLHETAGKRHATRSSHISIWARRPDRVGLTSSGLMLGGGGGSASPIEPPSRRHRARQGAMIGRPDPWALPPVQPPPEGADSGRWVAPGVWNDISGRMWVHGTWMVPAATPAVAASAGFASRDQSIATVNRCAHRSLSEDRPHSSLVCPCVTMC